MAKKKLPKFDSEAEEARWYYAHQDELADYFDQVSEQEGQAILKQLPPRADALAQAQAAAARHKARAVPTSIRLTPADIAAAKTIAARKGLGYQTWIKTVVHQAIEAEQAGKRKPQAKAVRARPPGRGRA